MKQFLTTILSITLLMLLSISIFAQKSMIVSWIPAVIPTIFPDISESYQNVNSSPKPLEVFKPFLGNWAAPDTAEVYKNDPSTIGTVFFSFQQRADFGTIEIAEHFKPNDKNTATFIGVVCHNPVSGRYQFLGTNPKAQILFEGHFEGFSNKECTRVYDVYYPKDSPIAQSAGQLVSYKERFVLLSENVMELELQFFSKKEQLWKSWGGGKYLLLRK